MMIESHYYTPDYQAMGDCRVCGHEQKKPWHVGEIMTDQKDSWTYFEFKNILSEAKHRLDEARRNHLNINELDRLEYWTAWVAHANAIATAKLLEESK